MPVYNRPAVEVACGEETSTQAIGRCVAHVRRIRKEPLIVRDGPGFIVNRLLTPYLNEAMLLLCRGVSADRIEEAALRYGMPMSPLELIDWIGTRTMFDAGRVFWQSFPESHPSCSDVGGAGQDGTIRTGQRRRTLRLFRRPSLSELVTDRPGNWSIATVVTRFRCLTTR